MIRLALVFCFVATATTASAMETQQGILVTRRWQQMDLCQKKAQAAFPDFTAEALAKRQAQAQTCLENQNLPTRAPEPLPRQ